MICLDENSALDFLFGRLMPAALADVERHLDGCGSCIELLARSMPFLAAGKPDGAPNVDRNYRSTLSTFVPGPADQDLATPEKPGATARPGEVATTDLPESTEGSEAPATLDPGTMLKGTYEVLGLIGRGGMGEVYEVKHVRLAGRYALKLLPPAFAIRHISLARFRREADITSALRHPNIVQVIDFDETPAGQPFLVMEYLEGGDLGQLMAATGPMPLPRVLNIVGQIVSALSAVHRQNIVHRDLKPQNVLLVSNDDSASMSMSMHDRVKLVDFGLSKRTEGPLLDLASNISRERTLLGTPRYMAPEQAAGDVDSIDATTDQFALGAMVYEMLTGTFAFHDDHLAVLLYKISAQEPAPMRSAVPDLPEHVELAVRRAMSKRKVDRFPTASDFLEALSGARELPAASGGNYHRISGATAGAEQSSQRTSGNDSRPAAARIRKRRLIPVGIGLCCALALGWAIRRWDSRPESTIRPLRRPVPAATLPAMAPAAATPVSRPPPEDNAAAPTVLNVRVNPAPAEAGRDRLERGESERPSPPTVRSRRETARSRTAPPGPSPGLIQPAPKPPQAPSVGRLVEEL